MPFPLLRIQPFKSLYLTYQVLSTLFIRIPLWILLAIPRHAASLLCLTCCQPYASQSGHVARGRLGT